jgi:hypothetical protein
MTRQSLHTDTLHSFAEVRDLVCKITGASRVIVLNSAFRRKVVTSQNVPNMVSLKGGELDQVIEKLSRDVPAGELKDVNCTKSTV